MVTADQIVAHFVGDYILQSDWMASEKTKRSIAALCHVLAYGIPFLFLKPSLGAILFIVGTHFVIDRWRLARYVCWLKNFLSPAKSVYVDGGLTTTIRWWYPWGECKGTGYHNSKPPYMSVWLLIIADNTMHVICNAVALAYL